MVKRIRVGMDGLQPARTLDFGFHVFHGWPAISSTNGSRRLAINSVERHGSSRVHGWRPGAARVFPSPPAIPVFPGKWFVNRVARLDYWHFQTCRTPIRDS